jgi:flavin reductase (DIM6/NTAB) family NADH-FMN oxidoreductase RutF
MSNGGIFTKQNISADDAQDSFSGFPVVLCTVAGKKDNIITLAMCHVFSFRPALVGVGVAPKRFSYGLLNASKDFAINIPDRRLLKATELQPGSRERRRRRYQHP